MMRTRRASASSARLSPRRPSSSSAAKPRVTAESLSPGAKERRRSDKARETRKTQQRGARTVQQRGAVRLRLQREPRLGGAAHHTGVERPQPLRQRRQLLGQRQEQRVARRALGQRRELGCALREARRGERRLHARRPLGARQRRGRSGHAAPRGGRRRHRASRRAGRCTRGVVESCGGARRPKPESPHRSRTTQRRAVQHSTRRERQG